MIDMDLYEQTQRTTSTGAEAHTSKMTGCSAKADRSWSALMVPASITLEPLSRSLRVAIALPSADLPACQPVTYANHYHSVPTKQATNQARNISERLSYMEKLAF